MSGRVRNADSLLAIGRSIAIVLVMALFVLTPAPARSSLDVDARPPVAAGTETEMEDRDRVEDIGGRAEARRERRADANGEVAPNALLRAKQEIESRGAPPSDSKARDAGIWNWEWLGPGNIGGRLRSILISPTNPNLMWLGTAGGGIWASVDGGNSWWPRSDFLPSLPVVTLAMDPVDNTILYAGTGELVGSNSSIPGAGIFKSTNGGLTWAQLSNTDNPDFHYVSRLCFRPSTTGWMLAGTATGVWRTTDAGAHWNRIFLPPNGAAVRDVEYSPTNANVIAVGTETDIYLSTDGGTTFPRQSSGANGKIPVSPGDCEITFAPSNPSIIYVSAGKDVPILNDLTDWIYRSTNGGNTWNTFMRTNADRWSNALWVSPTNPNVVVWGGFGDLYRTLDGTTSDQISDWTLYSQGTSAHSDQHVIVAHPGYDGVNNKTVFVGNDGGIQMAGDITNVTSSSGWSNLANNLGCSQFFSGSAAPDGSIVIGGTQDNGSLMVHPADGAQAWSDVAGGDGIFCAVDYTNPQRLFVTGACMWVGRSDNGGQTVTEKMNGFVGAGDGRYFDFLAPLVMDPNNPLVLMAGGKRIWRTTDAANHWGSVRDSLPPVLAPVCTAIDIAKSNSNVIWIGYNNGLISRSTDAGATWTDHPLLPGRWVTDIAINPYVWSEVVVTLGGYATDTVWLTSNAGASWTQRTGTAPYDLPAIQVNTVRYHPLTPNWLYVGTDLGVFASEDKGVTWGFTPADMGNEGPNNVEVDELFWQGTTYLLAATHGRGIYRCAPLPIVYVDLGHVGFEDGSEAFPYNTVSEAVEAYGPGAMISVRAGTYYEPPLVIGKRGWVRATGGIVRIE